MAKSKINLIELLCFTLFYSIGIDGIAVAQMPDARTTVLSIAAKELGVRETSGNNDGREMAKYLAYTHLPEGYNWCAAFVCWVYGQAGFKVPRNAWSPALFPKSRTIINENRQDWTEIKAADVFGIWYREKGRIAHVGLIWLRWEKYCKTIEGNSNNAVESRWRHQRSIYMVARWLPD